MKTNRIFDKDCDVEKELHEWASSPRGKQQLKDIVERARKLKRARKLAE